jgi:asparagine synthase (glutamine-hydrolysing)
MCGITGFVSGTLREDDLKSMTRRLQHRGPDAEGLFYDPAQKVGLGHRRLSILDLSPAGNQPFFSRDGRYIMVYNGEVYNFKEIASKYNIHPQTHSDTEIILEAYAKAGPDAVKDFNGMYALAIWDKKEEQLFIVRDRIGVKPLYFYHKDNEFAFASELKALVLDPSKKRTIDRQSVADFLYLGYIPGDSTIYEDHFKLLPGHYLYLDKNGLRIKCYWKVEDQIEAKVVTDEQAAKKHLHTLLESSVNYCMISDVPVGVFLSGGIDSSTVAAVAQSTSAIPIQTFSIGFKEEKYNESHFAAEVAKHIGSGHHEFTVTEQDALHLIDKLPDIYDEPYADSSAIPTYLVSQLARKDVTVALSGDGGDEVFLGYGFYYWARRLGKPIFRTLRKPIAAALYRFGDNRKKRASKMFQYPSTERMKSHIFSQEQYFFSLAELQDLLIQPRDTSIIEEIKSPKRKLSLVEEQALFDLNNYMPEELLVKADRASMQHGLEVRVPLLDHRLVEFGINLSEDLRLRDNTGKYLLKQVLYDYVPAALFNKPKWGFSVPLDVWLKNELHYLFEKYLSKEVVESCGLVHSSMVEQIKQEYFAGRGYLYHRLWALIILHKWYKEKFA